MLISALIVVAVAAALFYRLGPFHLRKWRARDGADWPQVERAGHIRERLPFFAFSSVVDHEYQSGRFGLRVAEDRASTLIREWINTKIPVRYDPKRPAVFSLPDELSVDGFRGNTVPETELASSH